jgi:hypothetical protein
MAGAYTLEELRKIVNRRGALHFVTMVKLEKDFNQERDRLHYYDAPDKVLRELGEKYEAERSALMNAYNCEMSELYAHIRLLQANARRFAVSREDAPP